MHSTVITINYNYLLFIHYVDPHSITNLLERAYIALSEHACVMIYGQAGGGQHKQAKS